jgi:hypothetical protein
MTAGVPRREKVRKGFTSPKGVAFLSKVAGGKRVESSTVRKVTPLYDQEKDKK